jgi:hypothetical protein
MDTEIFDAGLVQTDPPSFSFGLEQHRARFGTRENSHKAGAAVYTWPGIFRNALVQRKSGTTGAPPGPPPRTLLTCVGEWNTTSDPFPDNWVPVRYIQLIQPVDPLPVKDNRVVIPWELTDASGCDVNFQGTAATRTSFLSSVDLTNGSLVTATALDQSGALLDSGMKGQTDILNAGGPYESTAFPTHLLILPYVAHQMRNWTWIANSKLLFGRYDDGVTVQVSSISAGVPTETRLFTQPFAPGFTLNGQSGNNSTLASVDDSYLAYIDGSGSSGNAVKIYLIGQWDAPEYVADLNIYQAFLTKDGALLTDGQATITALLKKTSTLPWRVKWVFPVQGDAGPIEALLTHFGPNQFPPPAFPRAFQMLLNQTLYFLFFDTDFQIRVGIIR